MEGTLLMMRVRLTTQRLPCRIAALLRLPRDAHGSGLAEASREWGQAKQRPTENSTRWTRSRAGIERRDLQQAVLGHERNSAQHYRLDAGAVR
jgi:hypothetical protein